MATRTPSRNPSVQADLRGGDGNRNAGTDWTVFSSMKEFWFWVAIVTLIIFILMMLSFAVVHQSKQLKKAEALLVRIEEKERKQKPSERKDDE
jgi:heme/copper-type cytochrome/quinol oxidase subunit 2